MIEPAREEPGDHRADDRRQPEQPELADIFAAGEQRRAGAARRVDRGVGDRDRDQMDQGQRTDRSGCRRSPTAAPFEVVPMMMNRKKNVITTSIRKQPPRPYLPGLRSP